MKIVCTVIFSCLAAISALAADSEARLRERLIVCNQFVIEESGMSAIPDSSRHCCRTVNEPRDCQVNDLAEKHR